MKRLKKVAAVATIATIGCLPAMASSDPADIVTSASGQYGTAVAISIGASVIGAALLFIKKGLRGRM